MESTAKLVNVTRQKDALTANQAVTNSTSLNSVVDLFFIAGASRNMTTESIDNMLEKAWIEDSLLTLKIIFWAGDIRGGAGERRFFRTALSWLNFRFKEVFDKNFKQVPEFNRWDSLFNFQEKQVLDFIYKALQDKNALCAKWMPRKKQYKNLASIFRKTFKLSPKEYRKMLVELSDTVEQKMCSKTWGEISYKTVPSVAMNKYRNAFTKNDESRFNMYIESVTKGEEKINAGAIFPYQIYKSIRCATSVNKVNEKAIIAQWNALPDYMAESKEQILPVCDVSGSMYGLPIEISVSLGLYLSERNKGIFKDAFITFSGNPKMQYLKGDLVSRANQLERADWGINTDLNKVFKLVLDRAIAENLDEKDMPTMLLIISDMEFDECGKLTNYEALVQDYENAGYKLPKIVFWNVSGRQGNVPVSSKTKNVALVSGASPSIMISILGGKDFSPYGVMKTTLNSERYSNLVI